MAHQQQTAIGKLRGARQGETVGAVVDREALAVIAAAQYRAAIAHQNQAAILEQGGARQAELQRATGSLERDRLPGIAEISRTEQVAAQAVGQQRAG